MVGVNPSNPISGTLYKCTSPNTWTAFYTPFPYPHPLREAEDVLLRGDLNGDCNINIRDVQLCINVILETAVDAEIIQRAKEAAEPLDVCDELGVNEIVDILFEK